MAHPHHADIIPFPIVGERRINGLTAEDRARMLLLEQSERNAGFPIIGARIHYEEQARLAGTGRMAALMVAVCTCIVGMCLYGIMHPDVVAGFVS